MGPGRRIILGVDPGTMILGYSILSVEGRNAVCRDLGVVDLRKVGDHFEKLRTIYGNITDIIGKYRPDELAVEAPFYGKNPQVMLKLGRAQGAAISAALASGMPVYEYAPRKVKMSVTGRGAASKEQVAAILSKIYGMEFQGAYLDATDALAIATCHFYTLSSPLPESSAHSSWAAYVKANTSKIR